MRRFSGRRLPRLFGRLRMWKTSNYIGRLPKIICKYFIIQNVYFVPLYETLSWYQFYQYTTIQKIELQQFYDKKLDAINSLLKFWMKFSKLGILSEIRYLFGYINVHQNEHKTSNMKRNQNKSKKIQKWTVITKKLIRVSNFAWVY